MTMIKTGRYDLGERTLNFARNVTLYCRELPENIANMEYCKQAIRSSGSTGANYIEANEAVSKKDFSLRIKICRKEAKESGYWLRLIIDTNPDTFAEKGNQLIRESTELMKIFSAIMEKIHSMTQKSEVEITSK